MKGKKWIICFGSNWYSPSIYTENHLISRFIQDGYSVLWFNPIPIKNLRVKSSSNRHAFAKRILARLKLHAKLISKINDKLWVISPLFLPNVESKKILTINNFLLKNQIKLLKNIFNISFEIIISAGITDVSSIINLKRTKKFIQIFGDLYSDTREIENDTKEIIFNREQEIINKADIILVASSRVFEKLITRSDYPDKIKYFPHGVDFKHFDRSDQIINLNIPKPIAGYFGSLTDANDKEIYLNLAKAGFSVVLIGQVIGDYYYYQHENIYYLGPIDYEELPKYGNCFDVCIMAWKAAEWINNSNPCKTLEYLALGKPIVANSIPELVKNYSEFIYFADNPADFVKCAKRAVDEDNQTLQQRRKKIAALNDWDYKYNDLIKMLNKE